MTNELWNGFEIYVTLDSIHKNRYQVEFRPSDAQPTEDEYAIAEGSPMVTVEKQEHLEVIAFAPPPEPIADLKQEDYEEKALEAVQDQLDLKGAP